MAANVSGPEATQSAMGVVSDSQQTLINVVNDLCDNNTLDGHTLDLNNNNQIDNNELCGQWLDEAHTSYGYDVGGIKLEVGHKVGPGIQFTPVDGGASGTLMGVTIGSSELMNRVSFYVDSTMNISKISKQVANAVRQG